MAFDIHIVSSKGVEVDPKNMDSVKIVLRPLPPSDIRSFLALYGYYWRFLEGVSTITSPLTTLTQKKAKFIWSEACDKTFEELKDRLTSSPMLTLVEGIDGFVVYCDASRIILGCVLMKIVSLLAMLQGNLRFMIRLSDQRSWISGGGFYLNDFEALFVCVHVDVFTDHKSL